MISISMENFQSVREEQTVEFDGITLIYGNNSSGKSIIKDVLDLGQNLEFGDFNGVPSEWVNHQAAKKNDPVRLSYAFFLCTTLHSTRVGSFIEEMFDENILPYVQYSYDDEVLAGLVDWLIHSGIKVTYEYGGGEDIGYGQTSKITVHACKIDASEGAENELVLLSECSIDIGTTKTKFRVKLNKEHDLMRLVFDRLEDSPFLEKLDCDDFILHTNNMYENPVIEQFRRSQYIYGSPTEADLGFFIVYFCTMAIQSFTARASHIDFIGATRELRERQEGDLFIGAEHWNELKSDVYQTRYHWEEDIEERFLEARAMYNQSHRVNKWLGGKEYLDTGYKLDVEFKFLLTIEEIEELKSGADPYIDSLFDYKYSKLILRDIKSGEPLNFKDVGSGVSHTLPILHSLAHQGLFSRSIYVQQPELHLHPRLQANMAQIFLESYILNNKTQKYIIETHSELLILRFLKIIRDNYSAGSTLESCNLDAEELNVIFALKNEEGVTTYKPLRISKDGEFLDKWPNGFFEERDKELF